MAKPGKVSAFASSVPNLQHDFALCDGVLHCGGIGMVLANANSVPNVSRWCEGVLPSWHVYCRGQTFLKNLKLFCGGGLTSVEMYAQTAG